MRKLCLFPLGQVHPAYEKRLSDGKYQNVCYLGKLCRCTYLMKFLPIILSILGFRKLS
jgi:hypothetical protein